MHGLLPRDGADPAQVRRLGREQLAPYDTVEVWEQEVVDAGADNGGFVLTLAGGGVVSARRLLLATGMRDELPAIDGLVWLWARRSGPCPQPQSRSTLRPFRSPRGGGRGACGGSGTPRI